MSGLHDVLRMCTVEDMTNDTDTKTAPTAKRGDRLALAGASGTVLGTVTKVINMPSYYDPKTIIRRYNVKFDDGTHLNIGMDDRVTVLAQ